MRSRKRDIKHQYSTAQMEWVAIIYVFLCMATGMYGYTTHGDILFSVFNAFFAPLMWVYWLFLS